jgi:probable F420-dependent oxidoreductase
MHLGVILPNYDEGSTSEGVRRTALVAEELGFDSIWATEHIIVGPEAVDPYGRVYDPFGTLSWLAAQTERIALGTSIILVPLHHPIRLAKEAATLQELSGGRFVLGVGIGWHRDEYDFMRKPFEGRGRTANEGLDLMRALWRGERDFESENWSFHDATFGPLPDPVPEIWVGGGSRQAIRRAIEKGDVWHPTRVPPEDVRRVREEHPELRTIPRVHGDELDLIDAFLGAGVDGLVVTLPDEAGMRDFAARYR